MPENEWLQERYDTLMLLDEQRANALSTVRMNKARIERAFNSRVKRRHMKVGDTVLQSYRAPLPVDPRGKFKPNWAGPYKVKEILPGGAVRLMDVTENEWLQARYDDIMLLDEQRANALSIVWMNKARSERAFK